MSNTRKPKTKNAKAASLPSTAPKNSRAILTADLPYPMKSSELTDPYAGKIIDAAIQMVERNGTFLVWVTLILEVTQPAEYKGRRLSHIISSRADKPETWAQFTKELGMTGISVSEMYEGDVPKLLKGREVLFDFVAESEPGALDYRIEIVGKDVPPYLRPLSPEKLAQAQAAFEHVTEGLKAKYPEGVLEHFIAAGEDVVETEEREEAGV